MSYFQAVWNRISETTLLEYVYCIYFCNHIILRSKETLIVTYAIRF